MMRTEINTKETEKSIKPKVSSSKKKKRTKLLIPRKPEKEKEKRERENTHQQHHECKGDLAKNSTDVQKYLNTDPIT